MRPGSLRLLLLALAAGLAGCGGTPVIVERPPTEGPIALPPEFEYEIGPQDVLRVNVFGHPELSSMPIEGNVAGTPVGNDGAVMMPLVGGVQVQGRNVREAAAAIEDALRPYLKEPHVDVAVVKYNAHRYLVLGEVRRPGIFVIDRPTTAYEALAQAGWLASFAERRRIAWMRGPIAEENMVLLDAADIDRLGAQLIYPGDILFVGRRGWADASEAAREVIPLLQAVAIPLSIAIQAATLAEIGNK